MKGFANDGAAGPLAGVRVLEVSSVIMMPLAGRTLARLGAEVIRVEPPGGDVIRKIGKSRSPLMTGAHMSLGEGKSSITLDLSTDEGRADLRELVSGSDLVITNHLPKRRSAFGLDWESVREQNPRAILCTAQGFLTESENGNEPAYDDVIQARSGVCDMYEKATGEPRLSPFVLADKVVGMAVAYATLAALYHRTVSGEGQWVDVPMLDVMVDFNLTEHLSEYSFIPPLGPPGWKRALEPTRKPHQAADGWVIILPYSDANWRAFYQLATGSVEMDSSVPYSGSVERQMHGAEVQAIIKHYAAEKSVDDIVRDCSARSIPVAAVVSLEEIVDDGYLRDHGAIREVEHPTEGAMWQTSPNIRFSASPPRAPELAQPLDAARGTAFPTRTAQ